MKGHWLILIFLILANSIDSRPIYQIGFQNTSADSGSKLNQTCSPALLLDSQVTICQDSMQMKIERPIENADKSPTFPGGEDSLLVFIRKNLDYSNVNPEAHIEGRIIVKFVVTKVGKIEDVKLIGSLDPSYDKEVLRIVSLMPDFIPGMKDGHPVTDYYTLPIVLKIKE
jgi:hypothetical protein